MPFHEHLFSVQIANTVWKFVNRLCEIMWVEKKIQKKRIKNEQSIL